MFPALIDVSDWSIPDWVSVIGFPLGVVGLMFALVQLKRTKGAAESARDAVRSTQEQLADNQLQLYVSQLLDAYRSLEHAVTRNDHAACKVHLEEWRGAAVKIRTLVKRKDERRDLQDRLVEAVSFVVSASDALDDRRRAAKTSTQVAREHMRGAGDKASEIVTERMAFVESKER